MYLNDIPITHIRSKRKSLTLAVKPGGTVILRTPNYISNREIERFLKKQTSWLTARVLEAKSNHISFEFTPGTTIPYKGLNIEINVSPDVKRTNLNENMLILSDSIDIKIQLLKWYKEEARKEITKCVDELTNNLGLTYNRIFIRNQKTRWGSCSGKKNLNFSWKVILTKPELLRYLVVHEVCHLIEMNHSRDFWNLVQTHDPLFIQHRKELQKAGHYLTTFLE